MESRWGGVGAVDVEVVEVEVATPSRAVAIGQYVGAAAAAEDVAMTESTSELQ